jgi:hypothetical protein
VAQSNGGIVSGVTTEWPIDQPMPMAGHVALEFRGKETAKWLIMWQSLRKIRGNKVNFRHGSGLPSLRGIASAPDFRR